MEALSFTADAQKSRFGDRGQRFTCDRDSIQDSCRSQINSLIGKIGGPEAYFRAMSARNAGKPISPAQAVLLDNIGRSMERKSVFSACASN